MECRRTSQEVPTEQNTTMVTTLTENLCAFSTVLEGSIPPSSAAEEYLNILPARCLVWSALFLLLDNYCCPEKLGHEPGYLLSGNAKTPDEQSLQTHARIVVQNVTDHAHGAAVKIVEILEGGLYPKGQFVGISPLVLDSLYCTMATFHWMLQEAGDEMIKVSLENTTQCLRRLGEGWHLAREYLALEMLF